MTRDRYTCSVYSVYSTCPKASDKTFAVSLENLYQGGIASHFDSVARLIARPSHFVMLDKYCSASTLMDSF